MAKIIWAEPALQDLNEIAEYIALDKSKAAQKLLRKVLSAVKRLEDFPESGRKPPELNGLEFREIVVKPCRVFYQIKNSKEVHILYIMRNERELRRYLLSDRSKYQIMED